MALLDVLLFPDSDLKLKAKPIETVDESIQKIAENMLETMYHYKGVGLAATQVNIQKRMLVIDVSKNQDTPQVFINPKIIEHSGEIEHEEGCLSFSGIFIKVKRAAQITVQYIDISSQSQTLKATSLEAICLQHEIDHLDGIMFFNKLSWAKQQRLMKQIEKNRQKIL